jgi:hypothetical protein
MNFGHFGNGIAPCVISFNVGGFSEKVQWPQAEDNAQRRQLAENGSSADICVSPNAKGTIKKVKAFSDNFLRRINRADIIVLNEVGSLQFAKNFREKLHEIMNQTNVWSYEMLQESSRSFNVVLWKDKGDILDSNIYDKFFSKSTRDSWITKNGNTAKGAAKCLQERSIALQWNNWIVVNVHAPYRDMTTNSKKSNLSGMLHLVDELLIEHPNCLGALFCGDMNVTCAETPFLDLESLNHSHKVLGLGGNDVDVMWAVSLHRNLGGWDDASRIDDSLQKSFTRAASKLAQQAQYQRYSLEKIQQNLHTMHYSDHRIMLYESAAAVPDRMDGLVDMFRSLDVT